MITKTAEVRSNYARRIIPYQSAREAFRSILFALQIGTGKVLLPAFIGWSPREGSGVFDPIASLGLDYAFYPLDNRLRIDIESLSTSLASGSIRVLVIIHYFGYVDPNYHEAIRLAREHNVFVLEDEAHAMLSDIVGGICGRLGDACIYSFHKMLPVGAGGAAVINNSESELAGALAQAEPAPLPLWDFDVQRIAERRHRNSVVLHEVIGQLGEAAVPLFGAPQPGEIPQTYPILILKTGRDRIYHDMNEAGFGVVSLYHTMISEISPSTFPAARNVAAHIMNLPVHQDVSEESLLAMIRKLAECLGKN